MDVEEDEEEEYVEEEDMDMDVKKDDGLGTIGPISLSKSMDSQSVRKKNDYRSHVLPPQTIL